MYREPGEEDRSMLVVAGDSEIRAYDRKTGELRWGHDLREPGLLGFVTAVDRVIDIVIRDGRVLAIANGQILCFDYASGAKVGQVRLGNAAAGTRPSVLADGDRMYVAQNGVL